LCHNDRGSHNECFTCSSTRNDNNCTCKIYPTLYYNNKPHRLFRLPRAWVKGKRGDLRHGHNKVIRITLTFSCPSATISYWSKSARPCRSPVCAIRSGSWPGQNRAAGISSSWTDIPGTRTASWCRSPRC